MSVRERVARDWHEGSGHARDGAPFGGPTCNCLAVADRIMPMLAEAHNAGFYGRGINPYEEDQMDQKCSFCEEIEDDLTIGGGLAACRDCMAEGGHHVDQ